MNDVQIVGVLNVTPDSYYDGGKFHDTQAAVRRAGEMLQEGVDIIDVGGESTGPGSKDVPEAEELQRTVGVIREIVREHPNAVVSIDTHRSEVAQQAIQVGAKMLNDVTAGRSDPDIFSVAAEADVDLVLMYSKDHTPRTTVADVQYDDVLESIAAFLGERKQTAIAAGVAQEKIILDPGMGHFVSSDPKYSFAVLARLSDLGKKLGAPIYVSPSRKSCLAGKENLPPNDRLPGTIAASVAAVLNGASFVRTHDVLAVRRACEIAQAIRESA